MPRSTVNSRPVRLWRSTLAQKLFRQLKSPEERIVLLSVLENQFVSEHELRALVRRYLKEKQNNETFVSYLERSCYLVKNEKTTKQPRINETMKFDSMTVKPENWLKHGI